jgi:hypothetical protein
MEVRFKNFVTIRGSYTQRGLSNHITFRPIKSGATVPLRSPRIDSTEPIPPDCLAWRGGPVRQPFPYSVPSPHRLFKNSSTVDQQRFSQEPVVINDFYAKTGV